MYGVTFQNIEKSQKSKEKKRKKLLKLMNENPDWFKTGKPALVTRIQKLGDALGSADMDNSKKIKKINSKKFTSDEYRYLKWLGYSDGNIRLALGMSKGRYQIYKRDNLLKK